MRGSQLRWFGYVQRRQMTAPIRREVVQVDGDSRTRQVRVRPKFIWVEVVRKGMNACNLTADMTPDKVNWHRTQAANPKQLE